MKKNKIQLFDKFVKYYLWGLIFFLGMILIEEITPIKFSSIFLTIVTIGGAFYSIAIIIIPILTILFKKIHNIEEKLYYKNRLSAPLEKYIKISIILLLLVIPLISFIIFLIKGRYITVYYFFITISILTAPFLIYFFTAIYNLLTNFKNKKAWKNFGINIVIYISLFLYLHIALKFLFYGL